MTIDEYYQSFYELLRGAKTVGHSTYQVDEGMSYVDFRDQVCELLSRLSDDDFRIFATKLKCSKHWNVIIQAQVSAVNSEAKKRGWVCLI